MTVLMLIVSVLLILGVTGVLMWFQLRRPLDDTKIKWLLLVFTFVAGVVGGVSLFGLSVVPSKAGRFMTESAENIEAYLNVVNPETSSQVIGTDELKALFNDRKRLQTFVDENDHIGFIVDMLGARAFLSTLAGVSDEAEQMVNVFEQRGEPMTIHGVLQYVVDRSETLIVGWIKTAQLVVLALFFVSVIVILIFYYCAVKGWFSTNTGGVTFGDGFEE